MMDKIIKVQVLNPPMFTPSGKVVDRSEAWKKGMWMEAFNLWIVQDDPVKSIVYQLRNPDIGWAPNKLDVIVAGHYENLETIKDGLREAREEIGKDYNFEDLIYLGRKLNVGVAIDGTIRNTVNNIFLVKDNSSIKSYKLEKAEVYAAFSIRLEELLKVLSQDNYSFEVNGLKNDGTDITYKVTKDSFPPNWDNYHLKMAMLINRFFKGEKNLIY
jgi:hypothetical protein